MAKLKPRQVNEYHVFVASPGDMATERRAVRDFFVEYNRTTGAPRGVQFTVIDWENYSTAGVGKPQSLITNQTLERFKSTLALVIGLMGQRFGSPTGDHESGTEEEFEWALEQNRKTGFPEIKWFFQKLDTFTARTGDTAKIQEALEQFKKVKDFKKRVSETSGSKLYYKEFVDDEFADVLRNDLSLWLNDPSRPWFSERSDDTAAATPDVHREIEKACVHIREEHPDIAISLLDELRRREWDTSSPRERFRILANLGHAHRLKRDYARAATFYIDAKKHQPDDENARCLEALAEHLLGNTEEAYRLASDILDEHPRSTIALQIWLLSAPEDQAFEELKAKVPKDLAGHVEVAFPLARRAMQAGENDHAEEHARQAHRPAPDDPDTQSLLGQVLLYVQGSRLRGISEHTRVSVDEKRIEEAIALLSQAIDKYTASGAQLEAGSARVNRGLAYQLLGSTEAALRDYAVAFELAPQQPEIGRRYATLLGLRGEQGQVVQLLRKLHQESGDAATCVSLAVALGQRGQAEDLTEATEILTDLLGPARNVPSEMAREGAFILAELYAARKKWDALGALPDSEAAQRLDPESLLALRAVARLRTGDREAAASYATQALSLRSGSTPPATGKRLGHLFRQLDMPAEARQSLGNVIEPNCVDDDVRALLMSASEAGDDRFVLDFCSDLRRNGIIDPFCVEVETKTLVRYHAEQEAIRVLSQILEADIDEFVSKQVRLERSLIALRTDQPDFVESDLDALPAPDKAAPTTGAKMVALLCEGDHPEHAAEYAYALFRRHPNDPIAHMAVIRSLNVGTEREIALPSFETVKPGVGVVYQAEGETEPRWCIVEDLPDPQRMLGEIAANDPLAQELLGKSVGDKFITNKGGVQERTAEIKEIVHKFVRRFQDCLSGWEERFPAIPFVWRVDIKKDDEGTPDFSSVLRSIDKRAEQVEELEAAYRDGPLPLFVMVDRLGGPIIPLMEHLAARKDTPIRCCSGNAADIEGAMQDMSSTDAVVVDSTALATLFVLDEVNLLQALPMNCVVASGTMDELRDCLHDLEHRSRDHKVMAKEEGRYVLADVSAQDIARYRERVSKLIEAVNELCAVEPGTALADITVEKRGHLVHFFGQAGAESIALARSRKRVLWTDDFPLGAIASNEHGVSRVWTQVVAAWLARRGYIGARDADDATLKLLVAGYFFTSLGPSSVLRAAEKAGWDHSADPLRAVTEHFSLPMIEGRMIWWLAGQSTALLWREAAVQTAAGAVTRAILDAIMRRADGKSIIRGLRGSLDGFFGLDVVNARKARIVFDDWRDGSSGKLIVTP